MSPEQPIWVMDTTSYTHMHRAGHAYLIPRLAPTGVVLVPTAVDAEIENGRNLYPNIAATSDLSWAKAIVPTDAEDFTALTIKGQLGGEPLENLGECYVIACALHRQAVAILDDSTAVAQAEARGVTSYGTLWIVIEAYKNVFNRDRDAAAKVVDDLLATGMWLPFGSGESLLSWAYEEGLLP